MKENLQRVLGRYQRTFTAFTTGQKVVALLGTGALLLAAFMVFSWASRPSYAPLFSNMSPEDTAAVVEELNAQGVPYELAAGGTTVMVPQDTVYATRITLSGEGLPAGGAEDGYGLLDGQELSTSQFQEQTDFKRAMEGELARTVEGIDGVSTAVVHIAMPQKEVFAEEQDPTTASVAVATDPGTDLSPEQVQAVVHLVASSIEGLETDRVTVTDDSGALLTAPSDSELGAASTRAQQVAEVQDEMTARIQSMLDRVAGPGNATVQVTADLDFDKAVTESTRYEAGDPDRPALSESRSRETYTGDRAGMDGVGGVVGPDGQMEPGAGAGGPGAEYDSSTTVRDNAVDTIRETRETAPGAIASLGIGVVLDAANAAAVDPATVEEMVAATVGVDPGRGDTISVTQMPFDRSAEEAAAAELEAAADAEAAAARTELLRNVGLALVVLAMVLLAWFKGRRRSRQRQEATTYVVEQLRADALARAAQHAAAIEAQSPAVAALEQSEGHLTEELREELTALVERQPEDVATLLRGWLVEKH